jgi:hypothetical protein
MSANEILTESRLHKALERLLQGSPRIVKATGKLTLNKVNNEADLGHSYVYKEQFINFVKYAKPLIDEYNLNRDKVMTTGLDIEIVPPLLVTDTLKSKLKKAEELKDKYRIERDNAKVARQLIEGMYSELLVKAYDLQEELLSYTRVVTPFKNKNDIEI